MKSSIVISATPTRFQALAFKDRLYQNILKAAELGFDGIEIAVRDPGLLDIAELEKSVLQSGLTICAIGTGQAFGEESLSFSSASPEIRRQAVARIKAQIDLAARIDAARIGKPLVIIGLIRGIAGGQVNLDLAWEYVVTALRECAAYGEGKGVYLAVEPINRYETNLINTLGEGCKLLAEIGAGNVGLLADTFHMNIEEPSMEQSLKEASDRIVHVHTADSNRWAPGCGHIDFHSIIGVLNSIQYRGFLSAEILPQPSPERSALLASSFMQKMLRA